MTREVLNIKKRKERTEREYQEDWETEERERFTISQNMENKYGIKGKAVDVDNEKMDIKEVM